jgi:hypothetical protein
MLTDSDLDEMYHKADCGSFNPGRGTLMDLIEQARLALKPVPAATSDGDSTKPSERVSDEELQRMIPDRTDTSKGQTMERLARDLLEQRASARYRNHDDQCAFWDYEIDGLRECTCGYDALPQHLKWTT